MNHSFVGDGVNTMQRPVQIGTDKASAPLPFCHGLTV